VGDTRKGLVVLMTAVRFVLLIVCVNVSNLMMVRAEGRRHELAVRAALGASRSFLLESSMAERVVIAVFGTASGRFLATWIIDAVIAGAYSRLPGLETVSLDRYALAFSV